MRHGLLLLSSSGNISLGSVPGGEITTVLQLVSSDAFARPAGVRAVFILRSMLLTHLGSWVSKVVVGAFVPSD